MAVTNELTGLSDAEVIKNRILFGSNELNAKRENRFLKLAGSIISEPLFILLVVVALIYLLIGNITDSLIMLSALVFISAISIFQEHRSRNALEALKKIAAPTARVIRNGQLCSISWNDIVVGDLIRIEQGMIIPADAVLLTQHDFSVDESIISGESLPVIKSGTYEQFIYQGTLALSGYGLARVEKTGARTEMGRIGKSLTEISTTRTPLQEQIRQFVKKMVLVGLAAFLIVFFFNYSIYHNIVRSLLNGLTLAMSLLPEEIPVAFTTFMALGALKLYKNKVIAKNANAVETLGAATVICADKTGTLTENRMELAALYDFRNDRIIDLTKGEELSEARNLLEIAYLASESTPFNTMEKCIHGAFENLEGDKTVKSLSLVKEYPLEGNPPAMSHAYESGYGRYLVATKGSVETILKQTSLSEETKRRIETVHHGMASRGYRILGLADTIIAGLKLPEEQSAITFEFTGMMAFYDPPKPDIQKTFRQILDAGIRLKMITGDHPETACAIAKQIGMPNHSLVLTGEEIAGMDTEKLKDAVANVDVFSRMHPDAKLRVINCLKANGEVIAMIGDGVNDAPALKAAHIGVAMGQRGNEVAKGASSLILLDDELARLVDAIAIGRRIYENLKKAIRYIISIHIPIILIVMLPLVLGWEFNTIFLPVHVIFLELIMGPTCSIIFENEPADPESMQQPPRKSSSGFFSYGELSMSILQGLIITSVCLTGGYFYMTAGMNEEYVRTIIFASLIFSNIFLTLSYRSLTKSVISTLRYKNRLIPLITAISAGILISTIYLEPLREIFGLAKINNQALLLTLMMGFSTILWFELVKIHRVRKSKQTEIHRSQQKTGHFHQ